MYEIVDTVALTVIMIPLFLACLFVMTVAVLLLLSLYEMFKEDARTFYISVALFIVSLSGLWLDLRNRGLL